MKATTVQTDFTKRYVFALTLIAFLVTGVFYAFHFALKMSDSTALIVNISGKQRMLSQRIALLTHHYIMDADNEKSSNILRTKLLLMAVIKEMKNSNERLSSGVLSESKIITLSPMVYEFYFGETNLKHRVDVYLDLANSIVNNTDNHDSNTKLLELTVMSEDLLPDLNEIVLQYQKEGEESIESIKNIELTAWILTLLTLLMEVIFIFQPMGNKIRELFQKELGNNTNLEKEVQIRTFSLEQANEKLKYTASHDPLTGLNNRLNLEYELETLLKHYRLNRVAFAVLMLDIDWFKKINDSYGHDAGDFVLKDISTLICNSIRIEDSSYRAGGEEFVIIYNRISYSDAMESADALRKKIEDHLFVFDGYNLKVTISGGLYHSTLAEATDIHSVMKLADNALYSAKNGGRNRIIAA